MKIGEKVWDEDVQDLFREREKYLILLISLQANEVPDRLYWSKKISGLYTVKSLTSYFKI